MRGADTRLIAFGFIARSGALAVGFSVLENGYQQLTENLGYHSGNDRKGKCDANSDCGRCRVEVQG